MPQCNGNGNDHSERLGAGLGVLTRAPAEEVKALADALLPELGDVQVLRNRTGLFMLPMRDPVQGATFYLGEILVAEAHVEVGRARIAA